MDQHDHGDPARGKAALHQAENAHGPTPCVEETGSRAGGTNGLSAVGSSEPTPTAGNFGAEDVEELTEFDEGPLPADGVGELERRGIAVVRDLHRDAARAVLRAYGESGGERY